MKPQEVVSVAAQVKKHGVFSHNPLPCAVKDLISLIFIKINMVLPYHFKPPKIVFEISV